MSEAIGHKVADLSDFDIFQMARALVTDTNRDGKRVSPTGSSINPLCQFLRFIANSTVSSIEEQPFTEWDYRRSELYLDTMKSCDMHCVVNRRLFVTESGEIGLGPRAMRKNEVISILRGARDICVLRHFRDGFCFVGSAYVNGLMDGEVEPSDTLKEIVINLH